MEHRPTPSTMRMAEWPWVSWFGYSVLFLSPLLQFGLLPVFLLLPPLLRTREAVDQAIELHLTYRLWRIPYQDLPEKKKALSRWRTGVTYYFGSRHLRRFVIY
ncbi:hypothetical protein BDV59DRAFT_170435 [Aspergillus ambiguus]|uniref:uncharacterized protein n=1 Tax=Aspergillus ambiguus TaxID=176160 RepID=UPI003CCD880E